MTSRVFISPKKKRAVVAFYGRSTIQNCRGVGRITPFFVPNIKEETKIMQQPKLTLIFDGEPNINALPESEQKVFYTTLLERIFELHRAKEQGQAKK